MALVRICGEDEIKPGQAVKVVIQDLSLIHI